MTVVDALPLPPGPLQVSEKLALAVSGPTDSLPDIALAPDQAPAASQEVASEDDQVSVEDVLYAIDAGLAASDTVGTGGGATVTVADALALPPGPLQVSE